MKPSRYPKQDGFFYAEGTVFKKFSLLPLVCGYAVASQH